jgi:endonuclease/exonuclease/phosphatase family metal-dependent hydrolase
MRLVLATYNIHRCIGWDRRYDPDRIRDVIRELDADIIALQEVDSPGQHGLELAHWFGEETKLRVVAGPTLMERKGHHGNAVLLRCEHRDVRLVDLSLSGREPRGAIDMDISCDGETVQLIATHLGLRPSERRVQIERLLKRVVGPRCILMGDLNEWWLWGHPLRWIMAMFGHAPALPTFPAFRPMLALDRIWIRPGSVLRKLSVHRTRISASASDHLPLKAVLEWDTSTG